MTPQISFGQVMKHNTSESIWMVIHNDVYDVTAFLNEHPGGPDSLLDYAGSDGTDGFEEVGHSSDAREMMRKYKIGTLPPHERSKEIPKCCPRIPKSETSEKSWRTYDGSSSSRYTQPKSDYKSPSSASVERRVQSIVVPRERLPCGPPCGRREMRRPTPPPRSSKLKWALLALAGALIIGFALKKYMV